MAAACSQQDAAFEALTRKHALVCVPPDEVLTEEIVLAVGDVIGVEHVRAASRMNQKVVVFVFDVRFVHDVVSSGFTTQRGHFVMAFPMDVPAMKIIVSNVPPFMSNEQLVSVLPRYRKIVSKISMTPPWVLPRPSKACDELSAATLHGASGPWGGYEFKGFF